MTEEFRPWTLEEIPVGEVVKVQYGRNRYLILSVEDIPSLTEEQVWLGGYSAPITPSDLLDCFERIDGTPCGVKK